MPNVQPDTPPVPDSSPAKPISRAGIVALVLALIGLVFAFIAPAALFAWFFTLPAFIVAIVALTRRNRRKNLALAGAIVSTFAFLASIVSFSTYSAGVTAHDADSSSSITSQHSTASKPLAPTSTPTPTPTPTPPPALPDVSAEAPAAEQASLTSAGYTVVVVDSAGAPVADPTGYSFVSETPTAGTPLALGSTVTLTVLAPPPPVAVAPAPAPVVAPAPAPGGGATALCRDGTLSYSAHRSGTCSYHGGVAQWY